MSAVTFGADRSAASAVDTTASKTGKNFFVRVLDAIAYSQMKRAEREFARYRHLLPPNFDVRDRLKSGRENEPRGGW